MVFLLVTLYCVWLGQWAVRGLAYDHVVKAAAQSPGSAGAVAHLREATRLRPDLSSGWQLLATALALTDPVPARRAAARAVTVDPDNWRNWRTLSLIDFQLDRLPQAHQELQRAAALDQGFQAHYQLANLARLLDDEPEFWTQMKAALEVVGPRNRIAAVAACLRLAPGTFDDLEGIIPYDRVDTSLALARALGGRGQNAEALAVLGRSRCSDDPAMCAISTLQILGHNATRLQAGETGARALLPAAMVDWNAAVAAGALHQDRTRTNTIADPNFQFAWQGPMFSWASEDPSRVTVEPGPNGNAAVVSFDGGQADKVRLLSQIIAVASGHAYQFSFQTKCACTTSAGMLWQIRPLGHDQGPPVTVPIVAGTTWKQESGVFKISPSAGAVDLSLQYQRPYGAMPIVGRIWISHLNLTPQ